MREYHDRFDRIAEIIGMWEIRLQDLLDSQTQQGIQRLAHHDWRSRRMWTEFNVCMANAVQSERYVDAMEDTLRRIAAPLFSQFAHDLDPDDVDLLLKAEVYTTEEFFVQLIMFRGEAGMMNPTTGEREYDLRPFFDKYTSPIWLRVFGISIEEMRDQIVLSARIARGRVKESAPDAFRPVAPRGWNP